MSTGRPGVLVCGCRRPEELLLVLSRIPRRYRAILSLDKPTGKDDQIAFRECVRIAQKHPRIGRLRLHRHLGCRRHLQKAISDAFREHESLIILEDDTVPTEGFFLFCEKHLKKKPQTKPEIGAICGTRCMPESFLAGEYLSHYTTIYGWATWRWVWKRYVTFCRNNDFTAVRKVARSRFMSGAYSKFFSHALDRIAIKSLDTWDYQLMAMFLAENLVCLHPKNNLITNVGIHGGTHVKKIIFPVGLSSVATCSPPQNLVAINLEKTWIPANQWHFRCLNPDDPWLDNGRLKKLSQKWSRCVIRLRKVLWRLSQRVRCKTLASFES